MQSRYDWCDSLSSKKALKTGKVLYSNSIIRQDCLLHCYCEVLKNFPKRATQQINHQFYALCHILEKFKVPENCATIQRSCYQNSKFYKTTRSISSTKSQSTSLYMEHTVQKMGFIPSAEVPRGEKSQKSQQCWYVSIFNFCFRHKPWTNILATQVSFYTVLLLGCCRFRN